MQNTPTKLQDTLTYVLLYVQMVQKKRLSYTEMAEIGGVSQRTFAEWMRGGCSPAAVEAVLKMLALLPGEEIEKAIEIWRTPPSKLNGSRKKGGHTLQRSTTATKQK